MLELRHTFGVVSFFSVTSRILKCLKLHIIFSSCQYLYLFMSVSAFQLNEVQLWAGYKEDSWRYQPIKETLQAYYLMGEEAGIIVV